jgi:hypothetical protein
MCAPHLGDHCDVLFLRIPSQSPSRNHEHRPKRRMRSMTEAA